MQRFSYILSVLSFTIVSWANAQTDLSKINFSHLYADRQEVLIHHLTSESPDSAEVLLSLFINQQKANLNDYTFEWLTGSSYNSPFDVIDKSIIDSLYMGKQGTAHIMRFTIPRNRVNKQLVVRINSHFSAFTSYYDLKKSALDLQLTDLDGKMSIKNWLAPGAYQLDSKDLLYGYFYQYEFPPALPPMPVRDGASDKDLSYDSAFRITPGAQLNFKNKGLILIQQDSSSGLATGYRVESKYYPKLATLDQLIDPLIYITTREEYAQLKKINGDKKAFDKFWLNLATSSERAKKIIKHYYDRIENANSFFTTYKEGWKTDMGMIYTIFGPPDEVIKTNEGEKWHYLSSIDLPKLDFTFIRTESIFSNNHYVLIRDKDYVSSWYRAIDLWRKGRI